MSFRPSTRWRSTRPPGSTPRAGRAGAPRRGTPPAARTARPRRPPGRTRCGSTPGGHLPGDGHAGAEDLVASTPRADLVRQFGADASPRRGRARLAGPVECGTVLVAPGRSAPERGGAGGFGNASGRRAGVRTGPPPRVWCSWYRYFEGVTAGRHRGEPRGARRARAPGRRGPGRRRVEPRAGRGAGAVRASGRRPGRRRDPGVRSARRAVAGAVPGRRRYRPGGASRVAGRGCRQQLG